MAFFPLTVTDSMTGTAAVGRASVTRAVGQRRYKMDTAMREDFRPPLLGCLEMLNVNQRISAQHGQTSVSCLEVQLSLCHMEAIFWERDLNYPTTVTNAEKTL